MWSQSLAVGSKQFVKEVREQLGTRTSNREPHCQGDVYYIKEPDTSYKADLPTEMTRLSAYNCDYFNEIF